ncbi:hypothetical protein ACH427_28280 [Streptomyces sp. NPDC020379]|uniref:hypothetical protein n=1 Tax=Streptomyces sp. NPDC020379 TaxID=3365071 RepID=UPI0037974589
MNKNHIRMAVATAVTAIALGIAAPAANAAGTQSASTTRSVSVAQPELTASQARQLLQSPEFSSELSAEGRALVEAVAEGDSSPRVTRGAASSAGKAIIAAIKKQGPKFFDAAVKAAKGGAGSFKKWADGLSWYHPVRILIAASGADAIDWVVGQLLG